MWLMVHLGVYMEPEDVMDREEGIGGGVGGGM